MGKSHLAGGRKSGLTNWCAFGPQGNDRFPRQGSPSCAFKQKYANLPLGCCICIHCCLSEGDSQHILPSLGTKNMKSLVARAIRNAIRVNRFARIIRHRNPYFYSASGRFARITRISDSRESPDSRESCESIRANHATKMKSEGEPSLQVLNKLSPVLEPLVFTFQLKLLKYGPNKMAARDVTGFREILCTEILQFSPRFQGRSILNDTEIG